MLIRIISRIPTIIIELGWFMVTRAALLIYYLSQKLWIDYLMKRQEYDLTVLEKANTFISYNLCVY